MYIDVSLTPPTSGLTCEVESVNASRTRGALWQVFAISHAARTFARAVGVLETIYVAVIVVRRIRPPYLLVANCKLHLCCVFFSTRSAISGINIRALLRSNQANQNNGFCSARGHGQFGKADKYAAAHR